MKNKWLLVVAILGILLGAVAAYFFQIQHPSQAPAFKPASNPYEQGIYANGIIESMQGSGENINIYPEVSGTVTKILVTEGERVHLGSTLFMIDDSIQQSVLKQDEAQIGVAKANLKNLQDQFDKQEQAWKIDPDTISRDALDTAKNAVEVAKTNLDVAFKQWEAGKVLLTKSQVKSLSDGTVLAINTAVGSFISPQGVYDTYTGQSNPVIVMGKYSKNLAVRSYVDEILIHRLPDPAKIEARMFIPGTEITIPLHFERFQPNVSPKIELSNQRTERVDVRVLPVIFSFEKPANLSLYPGQLVDVYIGEKPSETKN